MKFEAKNYIPKSKKELFEYLDSNINEYKKDESEENDMDESEKANMLKTYIIESNVNPKDLKDYFNKISFQTNKKLNISLQRASEDKDLWILRFIINKPYYNQLSFFIDTGFSNRFWRIFSIEESKFTDSFLSKLITQTFSKLDWIWLPESILFKMIEWGSFRVNGIGIQHKYKFAFKDNVKDYTEYLSIRAWGDYSFKLLDTLRKIDELKSKIFINSLSLESHFNSSYLEEELYYYGKISSKEGDIFDHLAFVEDIMKKYRDILFMIEKSHRIKYKKFEDGTSIEGFPLIIDVKIKEISRFIHGILSAKRPFRIVGFYNKVDDDYWIVSGIDLHNGDKINLEISENWIRIYLPENSCGNTALRLFSNIKKYYDSNAKMESEEYGKFIS